MRIRNLPTIAILCLLAMSCQYAPDDADLYFSQSSPGDTPTVFAPGVISQDDRFEQFLLYAPNGRALVFGLTNDDWSAFTLQHMRLTDDGWTEAAAPPFTGDDSTGLTACWSFDGAQAFFTDTRPSYPPADIFMSIRNGSSWSAPVKIAPPISSDADEWEVSCSQSGTLYFSSSRPGGYGQMDIYQAPLIDGGYPVAENLGPAINSSAIDDLPYIGPDESYLIFGSDREGGYGNHDLYISYRIDGAWSAPQNLGPEINTENFDNYPSVSPDGEYLFFARRTEWMAKEDSDIYWVSAAIIDRLRTSARIYDGSFDAPPPTSDAPAPLGLVAQMTEPNRFDVRGAVEGSRAERGGVRAGDHIVAINNVRVSKILPQNFSQAVSAIPLVLTIERNGSRVELFIPDE